MYVASIPCAQYPQFPPNSMAPWDSRVGLGCPGLCCGSGCGVGLFDSGFDVSTWGWQEWLTVAGGLYLAFSLFFTTKRGIAAARELPRKRRKSWAARLRAQAKELSRA